MEHAMPDSDIEGEWGLYPVQVSLKICGKSEKRWTAYCFENNGFDQDRELETSDPSAAEYRPDLITNEVQDANHPIWNIREYFLIALKARVHQMYEEWEQLVFAIEIAAEDSYQRGLSWTQTLLKLLRKLLPVLSQQLVIWATFVADSGDLNYFRDEQCASLVSGLLHSINTTFERLKGLQHTLFRIQKDAEEEQELQQARLSHENNRNAKIMIMCISPVTVVSQIFAIPSPDMYFERSALSFTGITFLLMFLVYVICTVTNGRYFKFLWWSRMTARAKLTWQGDRANTTRKAVGDTVLQRSRTQLWQKKSK